MDQHDSSLDTRLKNMFWTICGDYQLKFADGEIPGTTGSLALYQAVLAGGRRRFLDRGLIEKYTGWRIAQGFERESFLAVLHWGLELFVIQASSRVRPGVVDIQRAACREQLHSLVLAESPGFSEELSRAVLTALGGEPEVEKSTCDALAEGLRQNAQSRDCLACLAGVDALYQQFFGLMASAFSKKAIEDWTGRSGGIKLPFWDAVSKGTPAAPSPGKGGESQGAAVVKERSRQSKSKGVDAAEQVVRNCGEAYRQPREIASIEKRLCIGPHRDCHIHYTRGLLPGGDPDGARVRLAQRNAQGNQAAYAEQRRIYESIIARLKASICNALENKQARDEVQSDCGHVDVTRLWRVGRVPAARLFRQTEGDTRGDYVVDLLVDGSFSQVNKRKVTAIQTYIIARALTESGIPCRVTRFYGFLDYTVLQRFRDYEDALEETAHIFEYDCVGSNRDGLAIQGTVADLIRRPEEHKILIVLSDGRPNDIHLGGSAGPFRGMGVYSGEAALGDTARAVRMARQRGIAVLGIFSGSQGDLAAEQKIYGRQFIYTRDKRRFADIVAVYLKRIIAN